MAGTLQEGIRLYRNKQWEAALEELLNIDEGKPKLKPNADAAGTTGTTDTTGASKEKTDALVPTTGRQKTKSDPVKFIPPKISSEDNSSDIASNIATKGIPEDSEKPQEGNEDAEPDEAEAELSYYLGLCYTKLSKYDDALTCLEQVVAAGQDPFRVYQCRMTLAYIYVITNRSKLAEFELHRLAKNGYESAQLYATLAYAAWSQKHFNEAIDYYEKALELDSNNTTALNGLGFILADTNRDLIRAIRYCKKAVDMRPQNPAYLDSLGWAYFKNGDLLEARTWLFRAAQAAPDEKEITGHLKAAMGGK